MAHCSTYVSFSFIISFIIFVFTNTNHLHAFSSPYVHNKLLLRQRGRGELKKRGRESNQTIELIQIADTPVGRPLFRYSKNELLFKTLEKLRLINSIKSGRRTSGANDFVVNEVCVCALIFSNKTQFDKYKNSSWWRLIRVIFKVSTGGNDKQKTPRKKIKS
jgi:hypothetical protein